MVLMHSTTPHILLSIEQRGMRLLEKRHSETGQLALAARAIDRALAGVNQDLLEEGAQPSFTAVLGALGNALADHLSLLEDPQQRTQLVNVVASELGLQVETRIIERGKGRQ